MLKSVNESVSNIKEMAKPHHLINQSDDKINEQLKDKK